MTNEALLVIGCAAIIFVVAVASFVMLLRSLGKQQRGKVQRHG